MSAVSLTAGFCKLQMGAVSLAGRICKLQMAAVSLGRGFCKLQQVILKIIYGMRKYTQIELMTMSRLNKKEKLYLLRRFWKLLIAIRDAASGGQEGPSVQSAGEDIAELKISAEEMARLEEIIEILSEATLEGTGYAETPAMVEKDKERCRAVNYMVRKVLDGDALPLLTEREAAAQLRPVVKPYDGFYTEPYKQKCETIAGFIADLRKAELAEYVATMGFEPYLEEAEKLNNEYIAMDEARGKKISLRSQVTTATEVAAEAQDLLDDMCIEANASVVFQPSQTVSDFIRDANSLFDEVRAARNQRGNKTDDEPATEEPDAEEPENPDAETPAPGTETPEEPDDRPVVQ